MLARTLRTLTTGLGIFAVVGCTGTIGEPPSPNEKVASLVYMADETAALVSIKCRQPLDCRLPNQHLCQQLTVDIYGDGRTVGTCWLKDGTTKQLDGPRDGIPLRCRSHTGRYAVHCLDSNNNVALDSTDLQIAVYPTREPSWYRPAIGNTPLGDGAVYLTEEDGTPPGQTSGEETPPGQPPADTEQTTEQPKVGSGDAALDADCRNKAINAFNSSFQGVIQQEGMNGIHYQPTGQVPNTSGFYADGSYNSDASQNCLVVKPACKQKTDWSQWFGGGGGFDWHGGGCYCSVTNHGVSCYTSLMITAAKTQACTSKPPECDASVWGAAVQDATVPAKQFVDQNNKETETKAGIAAGIQAGASLLSLLGGLGSFGGVNNYGSPLVLDLQGDGIALTSADAGVTFNLSGAGAVRTAWIQGDDALLAMDLDGNGRIDDGTELFGEDSRVNGFGGGDGFAALATLDRPQSGGNGNGLVEAEDLLFDQILLWRDANGDGVSQPGELTSLRSAGVQALGTTAESDSPVFDDHGNDLSARGSFLRADGCRGLLVDVYFLRP